MRDDAALAALKEAAGAPMPDELLGYLCTRVLHDPNPAALAWLRSLANDRNTLLASYAKASAGIEVSLAPEKPAILPGEPAFVSLIVKNISDMDMNLFALGDDTRYGQGMQGGIELVAKAGHLLIQGGDIVLADQPDAWFGEGHAHGLPVAADAVA